VKHQVPVVITSLGAAKDVIEAVHSYGGLVFHDVTNIIHARKAAAAGVDGIIAVCSGAGGHAGAISPFALVPRIREVFFLLFLHFIFTYPPSPSCSCSRSPFLLVKIVLSLFILLLVLLSSSFPSLARSFFPLLYSNPSPLVLGWHSHSCWSNKRRKNGESCTSIRSGFGISWHQIHRY
jgi:hypothetical protein